MTNEEVLSRLLKNRELLATVKSRKLEQFGYMLREPKYRLLQTTMQGKDEGKRRLGRKKLSWLRDFRKWTGLTVEELFRIASDRKRFKELDDSVA